MDDWGLGLLLQAGRIRRIVASYVGENKEFARQYLAGELEVELTPQGTLAERLRAGGSGIAAFYTRTGRGHAGGLRRPAVAVRRVRRAWPSRRRRSRSRRSPCGASPHEFVREEAITADFALVRAARGDRLGNLVFHASARNFNPLCAAAGAVTIAEVEQLVPVGALDPDAIHLPGIFVDRVVALSPAEAADKRIERRTVS